LKNLTFKLLVVLSLLLLASTSVLAINTPYVNENSGTLTAMVTNGNEGYAIGFEYGLTDKMAFSAKLGDPGDKMGLKYEYKPGLSVLGGLYLSESAYIGVNISAASMLKANSSDMCTALEFGLTPENDEFKLFYEMGLIYNLKKDVSLRGGFSGKTGTDAIVELGMGYNF